MKCRASWKTTWARCWQWKSVINGWEEQAWMRRVLLLDDTDSQVLERDGKLGELDHRTDALEVQSPLEKLSNSKRNIFMIFRREQTSFWGMQRHLKERKGAISKHCKNAKLHWKHNIAPSYWSFLSFFFVYLYFSIHLHICPLLCLFVFCQFIIFWSSLSPNFKVLLLSLIQSIKKGKSCQVGGFLFWIFLFLTCLGHTYKLFHFVHWFQNCFCLCCRTLPSISRKILPPMCCAQGY